MFHQYARSKRGKRVNIRISNQLINAIYRRRLSPCKKAIHVYSPALNNFAVFKKDIVLPVFEIIVKLTQVKNSRPLINILRLKKHREMTVLIKVVADAQQLYHTRLIHVHEK